MGFPGIVLMLIVAAAASPAAPLDVPHSPPPDAAAGKGSGAVVLPGCLAESGSLEKCPALAAAPADAPPPPAEDPRSTGGAATDSKIQPTPPGGTPPASAAPEASAAKPAPAEKKEAWYEKLKLRGYAQVRYNRLYVSNDALVNPQGDRSLGDNNGFFLRRARLVVYGDVHERVSIYLQPDFAVAIADQLNVALLRDLYADLFLDSAKEFRLRVGQSKVPYGFENLQSSQHRLPLDRSDALNSALRDERDVGIFFYWAPAAIRARFKALVDEGLKGSGDYGALALGVYNGQGANQRELNDNRHLVARAAWPFALGEQSVELGLGGYVGRYVVKKDSGVGGPTESRDRRAAATAVLYPKPFGLQVEYNVGIGPQFERGTVVEHRLHGGYALASCRIGKLIPYARGVLYEGAKKFDANAARYKVRELNLGVEWQAWKAFELTGELLAARRTVPGITFQYERGQVLRLQAQFNY